MIVFYMSKSQFIIFFGIYKLTLVDKCWCLFTDVIVETKPFSHDPASSLLKSLLCPNH